MIVQKILDLLKDKRGTKYFTFKEVLDGCVRHNFIALNASISFFTLFALVPLILLIFFILSQWLANSTFALSQLELVTSRLLPQISDQLLSEVINISNKQLSWGLVLFGILFLATTPLTQALRLSFIQILGLSKNNTYLKNKLKDIFSVVAIMFFFFAYIFIDLYLQKTTSLVNEYLPIFQYRIVTFSLSLILMTLIMSIFFKFFMAPKIKKAHLIFGGLLTSMLWFVLNDAFGFFIGLSQPLGYFYGSLRNLFISLIWLYLNTGAILIGAELIAALHKQEILILKQLFLIKNIHRHPIINKLMLMYGGKYKKNKVIFNEGSQDNDLYFVIEGEVVIKKDGKVIYAVNPGEYFGEYALLHKTPRTVSAHICSDWARLIKINDAKVRKMLEEDPKIAQIFMFNMARRLQKLL
ncbi:MAG: cyclic nucleotide-binding domain-containing protein [Nitrosomonadales bacterium]|jgi:membrane protein|nr:cyclic nucleotide-binding domain-containing protein [Nitrosomonadales bacterium]MBT4570668.1 cyclic nucleotide-binding domain-containing protein [Nitrosomonadales bacterium]MBT4759973.1 cyclic nucleotide-binding domain-containing protein [Nitrosomonadales bacterium]MBT5150178.1 cyclic nucleotide-binding domain-containing protein [Nitrosomonadales bacterium]MBT5573420.1 cyclic nucleotide-binding domain-containing protein [Nitrosomonadales bacterium]